LYLHRLAFPDLFKGIRYTVFNYFCPMNKAFLIVLDGWGHGSDPSVSAIAQAHTPYMDSLYVQYPHSELITYGEQVGLPEGQMGNSEVGHLNLGAGRIVYQELARINKSIREGELNSHPVILDALEYARKNKTKFHLLGLVSDGGVHSHVDHLLALCDRFSQEKEVPFYIHAFTDGRDTDPKSGLGFLSKVHKAVKSTSVKIASVVGRYYAMDRDKRWERIKVAYDLLVHGKRHPRHTA
jgi:2,3-bisphosphoglycerate-independent phosphoglycerate mutase